MSDVDGELLSPTELAEMVSDAESIEAKPKPEYQYRDEARRGGPSQAPDDVRLAAAIELTAARRVFEEMEDALFEAKLLLYEKIAEWAEAGVPMDLIAQHSGLGHRSSVQRVIREQLPKMRQRANVGKAIRRATAID